MLKNASLFVGACVFALGLAEMIFRIAGPGETLRQSQKVLVHEASDNLKLLYKPSPNARNKAYEVDNKINSEGFRDHEYSAARTAGKERYLFLGDSVVYGYGLELEETLPKQLERQMAEAGRGAEVLNFGVSGYDAEQAVEFFKTNGLRFRPDHVIVGYTLNDSIYASMELDFFHDQHDRRVRVERQEPAKKFWGWVFRNSRLMAFLDRRLNLQQRYKWLRSYREQSIWHYLEDRNKRIQDPPDSAYQQLKGQITAEAQKQGTSSQMLKSMLGFAGIDNEFFYSSHWQASRKAYEELAALSQLYGFKVTVVIFPYGADPAHYALAPLHDFLSREFEKLGFNIVDLMPLLNEQTAGGTHLFLDPIHFNREGSMRAAELIFEYLRTAD